MAIAHLAQRGGVNDVQVLSNDPFQRNLIGRYSHAGFHRLIMDEHGDTGQEEIEVCMMRGRDIDSTGRLWTYTPMKHKT